MADGGNIYDRILALDHFSEKSASNIIRQVLKAVHYMHSNGIVHRDLKPENVLLESKDPDSDIKVADFGLAVDMGFSGYHPEESMNLKGSLDIHGGFCGSPIAMAPEVAQKNARYGPQCDVWSIGCMAYELLSGSPPFTAKTAKALFKMIRESDGPCFKEKTWTELSKESTQICTGMLKKSPTERPSAGEVLHHPWFRHAKEDHMASMHSLLKTRKTRTTDASDSEDEINETLFGEADKKKKKEMRRAQTFDGQVRPSPMKSVNQPLLSR